MAHGHWQWQLDSGVRAITCSASDTNSTLQPQIFFLGSQQSLVKNTRILSIQTLFSVSLLQLNQLKELLQQLL